jgi:uncharacterized protein DUF2846
LSRFVFALLFATLAAPVGAAEKYIVHDDQPVVDSRRPAPGKALIYLVRTQKLGFAVKVKIYADGKLAGLIMSKTYIAVEVDPGKHEFIAAAENAGFLEAEVAADKIYFVQVAIHMGAVKARTHFEVIRPGSEAMKDLLKTHQSLRAITTTDEGLQWVNEEDPDIQAVIAKFREKGEEFEYLKPEDAFTQPPWVK